MEGFALHPKDHGAYFPAVSDPLAAGYWRYTSADGYAAADYAGATGTAVHTFVAEDGKMDAREETAADMDDGDK